MAQSRNKFNQFLFSKNGDLFRQALAEFLGTAFLVLFSCGACVKSGSLVATALTFGLTVMAMAQSVGHVSGCHINPGVTVGLLANGQIDIIRAVVYIIAQLVGSVAGAGILAAVLPTGAENLCATKLNVEPFQGVIIEAAIVFVLVFVVCNVCESNSTLAPVTIGLAVAVGHLFAVSLQFARITQFSNEIYNWTQIYCFIEQISVISVQKPIVSSVFE